MSKQIGEPYIEVGRISISIAKAIGRKPAKIYVSRNQIQHIIQRHGKDLEPFGLSVIDYIRFVCENYNQIRIGTNNSILLLVYSNDLNHTACIDLNFSIDIKHGFWEIKTAGPRRSSAVNKKALLWEAAKHTSNGRGNRPN